MSLQTTKRAKSQYFAQPYNLDATGFYFSDYEEYQQKSANLKDSFGQPVEEFELQFIDGENPELFEALNVSQATLEQWFDDFEELDEHEALIATYLAENSYEPDEILTKLDDFYIYEGKPSDYAAEMFLGWEDLPDYVVRYIDFDAVARDLEINGEITQIGYELVLVGCF